MNRMTKRFLSLVLLLTVLFALPLQAKNAKEDAEYVKMAENFTKLYLMNNHEKEFRQSAEALLEYCKSQGYDKEYYKTQLNLCLYEIDHDQCHKALNRANDMLSEMKESRYDAYSQVYIALGTIYEHQGSYNMAQHYFEKALNSLVDDNTDSRIDIHGRLAYLLMFRNPVEAKRWNDKCGEESQNIPYYRQLNIFLDAMIYFALGDEFNFEKTYKEYISYCESHKVDLGEYGKEELDIAMAAFDEEYDEALSRLNQSKSTTLDKPARYDMRIRIYQMMKQPALALEAAQQKALCIDSLNTDLILSNMNELNAEAGLAHTQAKASKAFETMLIIILVMTLAAIGLMAWWIVRSRRLRQEMHEKNEQLKATLAMAEEADKMKTEFVRSVSHEIRTPLNAINGFNDILNNSDIEIDPEERADMMGRIRTNVQAITDIIDDMLNMAERESNEFYPKSSRIYCNQFLSALLYEHREKVNADIELKYTTRVINRYQIETNEEGVRKVLIHLIQNAIKFTQKGFIELHCEEDAKGHYLLISLTDTGRGIAKDQQDKIFDSFYKSDMFDQGMGLGLTVSKKIDHKLGGELTLDTSYTRGARFVLSLPL